MSKRDEQERMDRLVLGTGELGALRFVVPEEIKSMLGSEAHSFFHASKDVPGAYIGGWGQNVSPRAMPDHKRRRLSRDQAVAYARLLDSFLAPGGYSRESPASFEAFVVAWYDALGRYLSLAQSVAEERASDLRAVKAAITGEV